MGIQVIKSGSISAYLKLAGDVALSSSLVSVVDQTNSVSGLQLATASIGLTMPTFLALPTWTNTLGTKDGFSSQQTVAVASAGTGVFRLIRNAYTINNTAAQTGSVTGYFLNATETALNGITHNLLDLQVGGVSAFLVNKSDAYIGIYGTGATKLYFNGTNGTRPFLGTAAFQMFLDMGSYAFTIARLGTNQITFSNNGNHTLNLVAGSLTQLGGTTSSFPAIKRNGAAIDFRLADDSAACNITAATINGSNLVISGGTVTTQNLASTGYKDRLSAATWLTVDDTTAKCNFKTTSLFATSGTIDASAQLQIDSTTRGFLMPRMTQAQILLILTPAAGLMVYNTDIQAPCFYDGTALRWERCSHSVM